MKFAWSLVFGYFVLTGIAAGLDLPSSAELELLFRGSYLFAIAAWFHAYALRHRLSLPMDMGLFLYVASFLVLPYYVVRAEGWRQGMRTLGWLLLAMLLSVALSWGVGACVGGDG